MTPESRLNQLEQALFERDELILAIEAKITQTMKDQMALNRSIYRLEYKADKQYQTVEQRLERLERSVNSRMARLEYLLVTLCMPKGEFQDISEFKTT